MSLATHPVYTSLSISEFKQILAVIDAPEQNANVAIILNIYIGICAIISIFIWYNLNISIFNNINYNLKSSKISLYK